MLACPSDDDIAAHVDGALAADAAVALGAHLDECPGCRATVVALVRARGTGATEPGPVVATAAPLPPLALGGSVGRYRLERVIGTGGMGVVYAAHDPGLERAVALKVMRPDLAGDATALAARMLRESRMVARVRDPAVVTVHDVGEVAGRVYLAMELIDGATLGGWLRAAPRPVADVLAVLARAGGGLVAAHAAGVVHRDFKPDNVLVAPADAARPTRVAVTDFGVARAAAGDDDARTSGVRDRGVDLTATGVAIGTPAYMAPEQLDGGTVDRRADAFAFAVTLWEALYGARPFAGRTPVELRAAIDRGPGVPAATVRGDRVPAAVRRALVAMLAVDPAARPTLPALLATLAPRRRRWPAIAAGVGALGVVAATAVAVTRDRHGAAPPDPCAAGARRAAAAWSPARAQRLRAALAPPPADSGATVDDVVGTLDARARGLVEAHGAACRADPAPPTLACLAARQVELDAVTSELDARPGIDADQADALAFTIADPAACHAAGASTVEPRWPTEPTARRAVADVRIAAVAAEALRDAGKFEEARAAAARLVARAGATGWPAIEPELLYVQGGIEVTGGDALRGGEIMQRAAALAERVHADYVAAAAWVQLSQGATWDHRDAARGLEYAGYADAASARLGRPPSVEVNVRYARGVALVERGAFEAADADLAAALALAHAAAPAMVPAITQGQGLALEERGAFDQAAAKYREALAGLVAQGREASAEGVVFHGRLGVSLANLGEPGAVDEARAAAALADRLLDERNIDRAIAHLNLAEVLRTTGELDAGLAEIHRAQELLAATVGERSDLYGTALSTESALLTSRDPRAAAALAERACEIQAFAAGDDALRVASCWSEAAVALQAAGRSADAERRIRVALPTLEAGLGPDHVLVANAYVGLGEAALSRGDTAAAIAAFEEGRTRMARAAIDPGYLATAEHGLARALARRAPARARALMAQAAARWRGDPGWTTELADAEAWLRAHPP